MLIPKITLRQIFAWTAVAACVSAVLAFSARGEIWATALVVAIVLAICVLVFTGMMYWVLLWMAILWVLAKRNIVVKV